MLSVGLPFVNAKINKSSYAVMLPDGTGNIYRMGGTVPNALCYPDTRQKYLDDNKLKPIATLVVSDGILFAAPPQDGDFDIEAGDAIKNLLEKKGYNPSYLIHLGFLSMEAGIAGVSTFLVANGASPEQAVTAANLSYEAHIRATRAHAANTLRISDRYLRGGDTDGAELAPQENLFAPQSDAETDDINPAMTVANKSDRQTKATRRTSTK